MIDLALARRRVRALYRHDRRGRLVAVNEWSAGPPVRFLLMRTPNFAVARFSADLGDDLVARLGELASQEPFSQPPSRQPMFADRYLELIGGDEHRAGPAFTFPSGLRSVADAVPIDLANAHLLQGGLESWLPDVGRRGPFFALVEDGRAVAVSASVRITPHVHCAGVETVPDRRGRGLAGRVVAAWAAAVRAMGAVPFYSTSWENLASRAVARSLDLELAGVDFQIV